MFNNGGLEEEIPFQTAWKFQSLLSIRNQLKKQPQKTQRFPVASTKNGYFPTRWAPDPVINGVIGHKKVGWNNPNDHQLPIYFRPFFRDYNFSYNSGTGAHLVCFFQVVIFRFFLAGEKKISRWRNTWKRWTTRCRNVLVFQISEVNKWAVISSPQLVRLYTGWNTTHLHRA